MQGKVEGPVPRSPVGEDKKMDAEITKYRHMTFLKLRGIPKSTWVSILKYTKMILWLGWSGVPPILRTLHIVLDVWAHLTVSWVSKTFEGTGNSLKKTVHLGSKWCQEECQRKFEPAKYMKSYRLDMTYAFNTTNILIYTDLTKVSSNSPQASRNHHQSSFVLLPVLPVVLLPVLPVEWLEVRELLPERLESVASTAMALLELERLSNQPASRRTASFQRTADAGGI